MPALLLCLMPVGKQPAVDDLVRRVVCDEALIRPSAMVEADGAKAVASSLMRRRIVNQPRKDDEALVAAAKAYVLPDPSLRRLVTLPGDPFAR